MIKLTDDAITLDGFFGAKIAAVQEAYSGLGADIYSDLKGGFASFIDGNMTATGFSDAEEFSAFLKFLGPQTLYCDAVLAKSLAVNFETRYVMEHEAVGGDEMPHITPEAPEVYKMLQYGEDGDISLTAYEPFALDYSLRVRRGLADAVTVGNKAICVVSAVKNGMAAIAGVAVAPEFRGLGLGKQVVGKMCETKRTSRVTLTCYKSKLEFYKKCGFIQKGEAALIHFGGKYGNPL